MQENKNQEINIVVLSDLESVRKRSGMYLGDTSTASICAREVIDNCVDECFQSDADTIYFRTYDDGVRLVSDNGRGLPIIMDERGITKAELTMTKLHSGSKFDKDESNIGTGMNGVGVTAVNFTSNYYIILSKITSSNYNKSIPEVKSVWESSKDKKDLYYTIEFKKGRKVFEGAGKKKSILAKLTEKFQIGFDFPEGMSTIVIFQPDEEIFESIESEYPVANLRYVTAVLKKFYKKDLKFYLNDELVESIYEPKRFEFMTEAKRPKGDGTNFSAKFYVTFDVCSDMSFTDYSGCVNSLRVPMGLHMNAAREAYTNALKIHYNIKHNNIRNGLMMDIICLAPEVQFSAQTKQNLTKVECFNLNDLVKVLEPEFRKIIKLNPEVFNEHVAKLNKYAESISKISEMNKADSIMNGVGSNKNKTRSKLPKNVQDCSTNKRSEAELFICEGSSAGSGLDVTRDSKYQSIFSLRGKMFNSVGADLDAIKDDPECCAIIQTIGAGTDINFRKENLRYGKILIASDADSDGFHIASLVLTLIASQMRYLIDLGMVYLVMAPLYEQDGRAFYYGEEDKLDKSREFSRYKGLGEMNEDEIKKYLVNKDTRRLVQVTNDDIDSALRYMASSLLKKDLLVNEGQIIDKYKTGIL